MDARCSFPALAAGWLAFCLVIPAPGEAKQPAAQLPAQDVLEVLADESTLAGATLRIPGIDAGDTTWVADWSFDLPGGGCDPSGWTHEDKRIRNDGSNYWSVLASFGGTGGITGNAAVLRKHNLAWSRDGYGNNWDYSIILQYPGTGATISFRFLSDSEATFDFFTVEADSAGASESRVNYTTNPGAMPADYRQTLLTYTGLQTAGTVTGLALPNFATPATTHEVYLRFESDGGYSDEDGDYPSYWHAGLVVDNIAVTGSIAYTEDFESALGPNVTLANTASATPFGDWARLWQHPTDNDKCNENTTCAWIFSDPTRPALYPDMAFGPGGFVVRNWLDNIIVSPWVSLGTTPGASATVLSYRRFLGQTFSKSDIFYGWRVRSRLRIDNTDTPAPGDSIDAVTPWAHASSWGPSSNPFVWTTTIGDMTSSIAPGAREIQVSIEVADGQLVGYSPPATLDPGPGPYVDRVRIGRQVYSGPEIQDTFYGMELAQDAFPSVVVAPGCFCGPTSSFASGTDIFGTCDFSPAVGALCGSSGNWCSARCDSLEMYIYDRRSAGITSAYLYGAIVAGPHVGKAPPPYTVDTNGFFRVPVRRGTHCGQQVANYYVLDVDDQYFRGGDVLLYCFTATDGLGGSASFPPGLTSAPVSVAQADAATGGLLEVSFLPQIDWDPAYRARIAADPNGKLTPTAGEIANSEQHSCVLYVNQTQDVPRSKPVHRSAFMATLDRLGYAGFYDVYDMNSWGNGVTNNQLAGRATVAEALGYSLIVHDAGRYASHTTLPTGNVVEGFFPQTQWYRDWMAQAPLGAAGRATLWLIGNDIADFTSRTNPLLYGDMGVTFVSTSQPTGVSLTVAGQAAMVWEDSSSTDFTSDAFALSGYSCPTIYACDGLGASGTAVVTHRYYSGVTPGAGATIANANPAAGWNSLLMSFNWGDMRDLQGSPPGAQEDELASRILNAVLLPACRRGPQPTDVAASAAPRATRLYQNVPNPFNPVTTIVFDLHRDGPVQLQVYDVTGRRVRTLVNAPMPAGWKHKLTWNGLDDTGRPVASGVYLYRLVTQDVTTAHKMILMR